MEKQEVRSVRMAMEDMDFEEEQKLHAAAQDEAAELVWKHQYPKAAEAMAEAPYANPDVKRDYREHLRKGSYQRSHSQEMVPIISDRKIQSKDGPDVGIKSIGGKRKSIEVLRKVSPPLAEMVMNKTRRTPSGKSYGGLAEAVATDIAQAHRRSSSGSKRILSGEKKMFMHPNDRIWEDPQEDQATAKPVIEPPRKVVAPMPAAPHIRKNPFARVRMQTEKLERSNSEPILTGPARVHNVEIQRNSPSQSKRPWYMSNEPLPPTPPSGGEHEADEVAPKPVTPTKEGREIRGDDIRAATSKQRSDYSPKLPRPTMVSDKPGRPIVSFKQEWKRREIALEQVASVPDVPPTKRTFEPVRSQTAPAPNGLPQIFVEDVEDRPIPIINLPEEPMISTIVLPEEPEFAEPEDIQSAPVTPMICIDPPTMYITPPTISINGPAQSHPPLPHSPHNHRSPATRPLPHHAATSPLPKSLPHYTPTRHHSGALCEHCALPIAGRVLSAAGQRFHPACFVCHQCHTNLELVAFYPEPEDKRSDRLSRISARQAGTLPLPEGTTEEEAFDLELADGDPSLRFYCHLDFHELFSPRCKSCKTPIEGEVIVACGAEWHVGHFFCAQCGDPFSSTTPFVEKDKYAWCVGCYTNRYSSKCRGCRKPVTDTVVKALGFDWHGGCFVCVVSCSSRGVELMCWRLISYYRSARVGSRMAGTSFVARRRIRSV